MGTVRAGVAGTWFELVSTRVCLVWTNIPSFNRVWGKGSGTYYPRTARFSPIRSHSTQARWRKAKGRRPQRPPQAESRSGNTLLSRCWAFEQKRIAGAAWESSEGRAPLNAWTPSQLVSRPSADAAPEEEKPEGPGVVPGEKRGSRDPAGHPGQSGSTAPARSPDSGLERGRRGTGGLLHPWSGPPVFSAYVNRNKKWLTSRAENGRL